MLRAIVRIRAEERRAAIGTFLVLFGLLAGHTLMETARDALFLASLPAAHLPWVYLAIAGLALVLSQVGARRSTRWTLASWLWTAAVINIGFWLLSASGAQWTLYAIYIWSGGFISLAIVQFWLLVGRIFTLDQAKRVYAFVGAGSVLGAIAGAAVAAALSAVLPARWLLLASALVLGASGFAPLVFLRGVTPLPDSGRAPIAMRESIRTVFRHPYLARLGGLVVISTLAFTLVDFLFKFEVAANVAPDNLGSFFALFYVVLNVLALIAQVFLTSLVLRALGVQSALLVLPTLLLLGAGAVAAGGGLIAALALKGADGSLKHSLQRTASEVLFLPLTDQLRPNAKRLIDMVGHRAAQALASLTTLAIVAAGGDMAFLGAAIALLCLLWIAQARALKPHYLELFRENLRRGRIDRQVELPKLDLGAFEALIGSLNSADDAEVLTALEILAASGRSHVIPALILHHPSKGVVLRSLEIFSEAAREDHLPITQRLLRHADPEIRAAVLRAHPTAARLASARGDASPLVRATALVALVPEGGARRDEALDELRTLVEEGGPRAAIGLAHAIARQPDPAFEPVLMRLAALSQVGVQIAVAKAMAASPSQAFVAPLIDKLAHREVRAAARKALVAIGAPALEELRRALADRRLPFGIRRHLPRAIGDFRGTQAATILLGHLLDEPSGMVRYRLLRELNRIRERDRAIPLDESILSEATRQTLRSAYLLLDWRLILEAGSAADPARSTPGHGLLVTLLADKETNTLERLVRLLGLWYPNEDFGEIYRGLRSTDRADAASSLELIENLIPTPALRDAVVALVAGLARDMPDPERLASAGRFYEACGLSYEGLLAHILRQPSDSIQAIAAYHVAELGLVHLREGIETMTRPADSFVNEVLARALERLSGLDETPSAPLASPGPAAEPGGA